MLKTVDKTETHLILKRTTPAGEIIDYLVFPKDGLGDASKGVEAHSLAEARLKAGWSMPVVTGPKTAPKSAYAQCAKGYRADMKRK